jgi:hypothetical protein
VSDDDIRRLLPTDKCDTDRAQLLVERGYPAVAPILHQLIEWLQDYNWPVAQALQPFLASIGTPLIPEIRRVLQTDDEIWKYWVVSCLLRGPLAVAFRDELTELAERPTPAQLAEGLHILARKILNEYVLDSSGGG